MVGNADRQPLIKLGVKVGHQVAGRRQVAQPQHEKAPSRAEEEQPDFVFPRRQRLDL